MCIYSISNIQNSIDIIKLQKTLGYLKPSAYSQSISFCRKAKMQLFLIAEIIC